MKWIVSIFAIALEFGMMKIKSKNRLNPSKKPIKSKFMFRHKLLTDKTYKYKARLVTCGYSQKYGKDFIHLLQQQNGNQFVYL
jgi:hypothetical protein